jgi:hypothetical protein
MALNKKCTTAANKKARVIMALARSTLSPWNLRMTPPVAKHKQAIKE